MPVIDDSLQRSPYTGDIQISTTNAGTSSSNPARAEDVSGHSSVMQFITEPVTHLRNRKRKWASSKHYSPVEGLTSTSTESPSENESASSSSMPIISTSHWGSLRRKRSAATERVAAKIKIIFRRDSHQVDNTKLMEKAYQIHRDMHLENNIPGAPMIIRPNCYAYVHAFFDWVGEAGPSNFYETEEWRRYHRCQQPLQQATMRNAAVRAALYGEGQGSAGCPWAQPLQSMDMTGQQLTATSNPDVIHDSSGEPPRNSSTNVVASNECPDSTSQQPDQPHPPSAYPPALHKSTYSPGIAEAGSDSDGSPLDLSSPSPLRSHSPFS